MFKIDIHTHIIPENLPDYSKIFGYDGFINLEHIGTDTAKMMKNGQTFRVITSNCWCAKDRIHECNETEVDVQVLSTIPVLFNYWAQPSHTLEISEFLNNHIAETVNNDPKRFVGLATIPMQDSKLAIKELERSIIDLKLSGIQIGTNINDLNLNEERFFPIYEAAQDLNAAIFVHPWDMMGKEKMQKYWLPWLVGMPAESSRAICSMIFGGVFEKFPKLKVCFAHGGGSFPATIGRIEHGYKVRPDLVAVDNNNNPKNYIGKFYIDSLVHDSVMLRNLIDLFGANRIALGSDYPFPLGESIPGNLIESMQNISQEEKEYIFYKTALDWLSLEHKRFL